MDSFELRWPKCQAMLYTDGARLKIVVRDDRGPSGTISNLELCKQRIAFGLEFAPGLIPEMKARGHVLLAEEIEQLASTTAEPEAPADLVGDWLNGLAGSDAWQACGTKRAKVWHPVGDNLLLKTPPTRGKQEWVLKTTSAEAKPSYLAAADFKGICCALRDEGAEFFDAFLGACADFADEHPDIGEAIRGWCSH